VEYKSEIIKGHEFDNFEEKKKILLSLNYQYVYLKKNFKIFNEISLLSNVYIYKHFLDNNCINTKKSTEGFDYWIIIISLCPL